MKYYYHLTSFAIVLLIKRNEFNPGNSGWFGHGINFVFNPKDTDIKAQY